MNQNKIVNLINRVLKSNGTKLKKLDEYMYWSPFVSHHKQKLQVNIRNQNWHCWVTGTGGRTLFQLFKKVNASKQHIDELNELVGDSNIKYKPNKDTKTEKVNLPESFKPLWNGGDSITKRHALNYLYKRNITDEDIIKYNIGYCDEGKYSNRIIIPSYDSEGQLNFFVGRDFYSSNLKYLNSFTSKNVIGFELFINWEEPIILCGGVFDAMAFRRNAIPLFGKTLSDSLKKKIIEFQVKTIYLALDTDAQKESIVISQFLIDNGIEVKTMKFEEKDPSEIGFKNLLNLLNKTNTSKFSDIMRMRLKGF